MTEVDQKQLAELVGQAIARQRMQKHLTQDELAERLGIGSEAVSRIERGVVIPNIARLLEIAQILGCSAAELLGDASPLADDQAQRITRLLKPLSPSDRRLILDMLESLANRLHR